MLKTTKATESTLVSAASCLAAASLLKYHSHQRQSREISTCFPDIGVSVEQMWYTMGTAGETEGQTLATCVTVAVTLQTKLS